MTAMTIISDRYAQSPEAVESVEAFNAYCVEAGWEVPELTRRSNGRWYNDKGEAILEEAAND